MRRGYAFHASGKYICESGLAERGIDSRGRRICGTREYPSPYYGLSRDGRCVFTCARGTQPDPASGECICRPGLDEVATDDRGQRIVLSLAPVHTMAGAAKVTACGHAVRERSRPMPRVPASADPAMRRLGADTGGRRVHAPFASPVPCGNNGPLTAMPHRHDRHLPQLQAYRAKVSTGNDWRLPQLQNNRARMSAGNEGRLPEVRADSS